ncbi:ABC transporter permease [Flammeovirga pacifica]|nr:ABC transporter permease [Flammeovirga pacifica]
MENLFTHKARNITTGLGVSWGLFILILLLGGGEGLYNGIQNIFSGYAQNTVWVYGGETSKVYKGKVEGERIDFDPIFLDNVQKKFKEIDQIALDIKYQGHLRTTYYRNEVQSVLKGVNNAFFELKKVPLKNGRHFNLLDLKEHRNVCIIGQHQQEVLFHKESALEKTIYIDNIPFTIVGELENNHLFSQSENRSIFIPLDSYHHHFEKNETYSSFGFVLNEKTNEFIKKKFKPFLSESLGFDPKDNSAIYLLEAKEQKKSFDSLFNYINGFLWSVGICLLLSGMISISNMMVMGIKERTKELGIRKALGATPKELLIMIITESTILTFISGAFGILLGVFSIELINYLLRTLEDKMFIEQLEINILVIFTAFILLIFSGIIAGLIPAKKAMNLTVVYALNEEN